MGTRTLELLDLAFRWVHVIAGIMWVGNSLLFNWLDRTLQPPSRPGAGRIGETWLLHSGAFYFVEKTQLDGEALPRPLHWFKWQAYTTWLSGFALLLVVYWIGGRALLVDPAVAALSPGTAVGVGVATVLGGWLLYDGIWRFIAPRSVGSATALSLVALLGIVVAATHLLSGRAAFIHVGAMLGTIMAGNVARTIVPSQHALVAGVAGGNTDHTLAARAKMRSIHNNYLTFPVIALMLGAHFSWAYGHRLAWLVLLFVLGVGAAVRHLMNVRFVWPAWRPALVATVIAAFVALYAITAYAPRHGPASASPGADLPARPTFADVRPIIDRRCAACHSLSPSDDSFGVAPGGVAFDSPAQMRAFAPRIRARAVDTRTMPPANKTRITDRERAMLGRWIEQGGAIP